MSDVITLSARDYDAVLFDLDGVLTRTASVHAAAWKKLFDGFLEQRASQSDEPFVPFDIVADYQRYVDGKPRYDGVAIYIGIVPAELIRGHPPEHPEAIMHGRVPAGESHLTVAVYDAKSGWRISNAAVTARIADDRGLNMRTTLEPMLIADSPTFGNYVSLRGAGPYRIEIEIQVPGRTKAVIATFTWARS